MTANTLQKPGFLVAGTASGVGKTTVTLAIIAALRRRGFVVQPFKGGPDFLDTGHHTRIAGRIARNLDTWMLSHASNREVFRQASVGADVLIIEGMMGLFDGKDRATETGSSAEIAKLLELPVILVLDASKSARSIAAVVLGFELFDSALPLAGIVLNRVASERHYRMLETAILSACRTPVLGWLPRTPSISIPERHLGLHEASESDTDIEQQLDALAALAEAHLDLNKVLTFLCGLHLPHAPSNVVCQEASVRIGVARDSAFIFYYEDNLDLLRSEGEDIVFFSPMRDRDLPPALDALYLGGGYPELHAAQLSENTSMLSAIREFAASGRPVYAECGGMMYLCGSLTTKEGCTYSMAGVFPFCVEMTARLVRFGYVTVAFGRACILGPAGTVVRGHSFHHSRMVQEPEAPRSYQVQYSLSGEQEQEGFTNAAGNVLASYVHLHFRANVSVAKYFVAAALAGRPASTLAIQ